MAINTSPVVAQSWKTSLISLLPLLISQSTLLLTRIAPMTAAAVEKIVGMSTICLQFQITTA